MTSVPERFAEDHEVLWEKAADAIRHCLSPEAMGDLRDYRNGYLMTVCDLGGMSAPDAMNVWDSAVEELVGEAH